jgi:hypothetical protein
LNEGGASASPFLFGETFMRKTLKERFEEKVDRSGDCHIWTASVSTDGYGQIGASVDGLQKNLSAHRLAYEWAHGPIPDGMYVCHTCDTKRCVNPDHLFAGTAADNHADMHTKGRQRHLKGEDHGMAKLSEAAARFTLNSKLSAAELAKRFGVKREAIYRVRSGKRWPHIYQEVMSRG